MQPSAPIYRFGLFELDLRRQELRREGVRVPLQEQPLRLLVALVESRGALIERQALRHLLWEPDVHVDFTAGIHSAVRRAREALGDDADSPRYIQTVPRRGYRFLAPVETVVAPGAAPAASTPANAATPEAPPPQATRPPRHAALGWTVAGWLLAGLLAALVLVLWVRWMAVPTWPPNQDIGSASSRPQGARPQGAARSAGGPGDPATVETAVHSHFERARLFADRRSREGLVKSIAEYQSGLALAPTSDALLAEGYSGLAVDYVMLGFYDYWRPTDAFGPARLMAERALAIDDSSASANLAMSLVYAVSDWDWSAAETAVDRALTADPALPEAHLWRAVLLSNLARHDEALAEIDRALAAAPVNPVLNTARGWLLFAARRGDEAIEQSRRTLELAPDYYDAWDNLKWFHITRGEIPEAARAWARAAQLEGGDGDGLLAGYQRHGFPYLLRESVQRKLNQQRDGYSSPYDLALDYTALGEIGPALDQLERSHAEHETDLLSLAVDPRMDALRGEPRFQALLERMGLALHAAPPS
jgi:DNA-binding winged helix-turn-helix (wHTH) protein/tetratricopeptide (TPR) repeat protein